MGIVFFIRFGIGIRLVGGGFKDEFRKFNKKNLIVGQSRTGSFFFYT